MKQLAAVAILLGVLLAGCSTSKPPVPPKITFTQVPPFEQGSSEKTYNIEGQVEGTRADEAVVLYAKSGIWWVQPTAAEPLTTVARDGLWRNTTHPGTAYAALLVRRGFRAALKLESLPEVGPTILAIAQTEGDAVPDALAPALHFSGYDWEIRTSPSNPGGTPNLYDPANAWTDNAGRLHMRIAGPPGHLKSAEIRLNRSLGYGTYRFIIQDLSKLDQSAVFSMLTWDDSGPSREMDIEISRWGQPASRNGQFVIQPYYIPANTFRFATPPRTTTFMLQWGPDRAEFKTFSGAVLDPNARAEIDHVFTAAVPSPGNERIHMDLYVFDNEHVRSLTGAEVVVENFEFLP